MWTFLAPFPWPLQRLDLISHVIRGCVNQQLGVQMKECQLLPVAQQSTEQDPLCYSLHNHKYPHMYN